MKPLNNWNRVKPEASPGSIGREQTNVWHIALLLALHMRRNGSEDHNFFLKVTPCGTKS